MKASSVPLRANVLLLLAVTALALSPSPAAAQCAQAATFSWTSADGSTLAGPFSLGTDVKYGSGPWIYAGPSWVYVAPWIYTDCSGSTNYPPETLTFKVTVGNGAFFNETTSEFTCTRPTSGPPPGLGPVSCTSPGDLRLYSTQGAAAGTAKITPGPKRQVTIDIYEENGAYFGPKTTDINGNFSMKAAGSNNWGISVFRAAGVTSGGGSRKLYFEIHNHPESRQAANITSNQLTTINLGATEEQCTCESRQAGGPSAPAPPTRQGNPVCVSDGEMTLNHTDGASGDLALDRHYSSFDLTWFRSGMFGFGWNTSLDRRLYSPSAGFIRANTPRGARFYYDEAGDGTLEAQVPLTSWSWIETLSTEYKLVYRKGGFEIYDKTSGRIKSEEDAAGVTTTYTRDASQRLTSVTRNGRSLTFTYVGSSTQPAELKVGATVLARYSYMNGFLTQVSYPDGSGLVYATDVAGRILAVNDAQGKRLETHTYDAQGRALTDELTDGRELLSFAYDTNQTTMTNALGDSVVFEWTTVAGARLVKKLTGPCATCGPGDSQEWAYDARGNIVSYKDGLGKEWTFVYSANDELLTETDPLNHTTTYTYDSQGRLVTRTGPDGSETTYVQSPSGPTSVTQKVSASPVATRTTAMGYFATSDARKGKVATITDPRGKITTMAYDTTTGDLLSVADPLGHVTSFLYDSQGRRTKVTDALNHDTTTTYDVRGRVTRVTNTDATYTDFRYDQSGMRSEVIDPMGRRTRYVYDAWRRLTGVVDPMNGATAYAYDLMGNLTSLTDARGQVTSFEYDPRGKVKKTIYPGGAYETFAYDAGGRLTSMTDRKSIVTTYTYDDLGRLVGKSFANDPTNTPAFSYTYDAAGRMLTAVNGSDTLTWTYNLAGELLNEQSAANASNVAYTYDDGGNRATVSLDGALFVSYAYDDASRLTTISRGALNFGFSYDNANRRTGMSYPNGVNTVYQYDNLNRLTNLAATHTASGTPITNFGYQYDAAGNRTQKSTLDFTEDYKYDNLYRLTRADRTNPGATLPNQWTWSYDQVGNRTSAQKDSEATTSSYNEKNQLTGTTGGGKMLWRGVLDEPGNVNMTSAAASINGQPARMLAGNVFEAELNLPPGANNVTIQAQDGSGNIATKVYSVNVIGVPATYTYDANGNLTQKVEGADTWVYTWNALNQLTAVTKNAVNQATYSYDPSGRRVEKIAGATATAWTYDRATILRQSVTAASVTTTTRFIHGPGVDAPLAQEDATSGAATHLHADALGSIVRHTDGSGALSGSISYDAWGNVQSGTPAPYAFTGREWDPSAQMHYYRARYYDPQPGRFISQDPAGLRGGINLYGYVAQRPTLLQDPSGLTPQCPSCPDNERCPSGRWFQGPTLGVGGAIGGGVYSGYSDLICDDRLYVRRAVYVRCYSFGFQLGGGLTMDGGLEPVVTGVPCARDLKEFTSGSWVFMVGPVQAGGGSAGGNFAPSYKVGIAYQWCTVSPL